MIEIANRVYDERHSDTYLSFKQIETEFGCSRSWIYRQHAYGHLQIYKFGGKTRIKRSEMEKLAIAQ